MNTVDGVWGVEAEGTASASDRLVVEAVLSWRDTRGGNVLAVKELAAGGTLAIGDSADLVIPGDVLGLERFELARFDGERAVVTVPPGAKLRVDGWERSEREMEIARGHVTEVLVGAFAVRLTITRAGTRIAAAPLEGLRRGGAGMILASALAHAAAFAVIAYASSALGATEEDPFDRDRAALLEKYLNASAEREQQQEPVQAQQDALTSEGGNHNPGAAAQGTEGAAGKDTPNKDGRWAAKGTAKPEDATLAREKALSEAANWGVIGMLPGFTNDPNAPTVPWGTTLNGSDDVSKVGHLFGSTIDDAWGTGGWGLSGIGEAGGGTSQSIGIGDFGSLGIGGTGHCGGKDCSGIGSSHDRLMGTHVSHFRGPRYGVPQSNGHLPPEVIQRIVRQNDGRYRFCYQQALKTNPDLEGRVTVKFLIARDGSVAFSADGGSDIPDTGVRQCVISSFTQLSFPSPDSGVVTVVYPLVFSPQ
ncbi:MAG TPA: AgmX/PglI C-terminal domain-containing protein [Polyangiaceae bacterium]